MPSSKKLKQRRALVSRCLRQCALTIDPLRGHLKEVAKKIDVHPVTISVWIRDGRVPPKSARALLAAFGEPLVDVDALTGGIDD